MGLVRALCGVPESETEGGAQSLLDMKDAALAAAAKAAGFPGPSPPVTTAAAGLWRGC